MILDYESITFKPPDIRFFNSLASLSHPDIKAIEKNTRAVVKLRDFRHSYNHPLAASALEEVGFIGMKSCIEEAKKLVIRLVEKAATGKLVQVTEVVKYKRGLEIS